MSDESLTQAQTAWEAVWDYCNKGTISNLPPHCGTMNVIDYIRWLERIGHRSKQECIESFKKIVHSHDPKPFIEDKVSQLVLGTRL